MSTLHVDTQEQLEALPDGTIISWRRIPGDETSRALAFVRVEVVTDQSFAYDVGERIVWISPGGWAPQTPESAEITYPVEVIRLGEFRPEGLVAEQMRAEYFTAMANAVDVPPPATFDLLHGGTWARETALKAAVHLYGPDSVLPQLDHVLATAEAFEAWLDRDPAAASMQDLAAFMSPQPGDPPQSSAPTFPHGDDDQAPEREELLTWLQFLRDRGVTATALRHLVAQVWSY